MAARSPTQVHARRPLSGLLVKATLVVAWSAGLVISGLQIAYDLQQVRNTPDVNLATVRGMTQEPLDAIVYSMDKDRASDLLAGLLTLPYIRAAKVVLDDGTVLAEASHPLQEGQRAWVSHLLFGPPRQFVWSIHAPVTRSQQWLGEIQLNYDTHAEASAFLSRAAAILLGNMAYAFVLAALLLAAYDRLLRRPLTNIIQSIVEADTERPESTRLAIPPGHEDSEIGQLATITNLHLESIERLLAQLREAEQRLNQHSDRLEVTVAERTRELTRSLTQLQLARDQLISSEKMASLGALVAGVAHEVNTPLGIAVTAASVVGEALESIAEAVAHDALSKEQFQTLLRNANDGQHIVVSNLSRAARLVKDFKQTAATQVDESLCAYDMVQTLRALIASLRPETKKVPVVPQYFGPAELQGMGYPGVLMQILTNLIINSVYHAFEGVAHPRIRIEVRERDGQVELLYRDNGVGVPAALHTRIFEPLFTTRRGSGGTGLGLNIVYNLVTQKLGGALEFWSAPQRGVSFRLSFALKLNPEPGDNDQAPQSTSTV